MQLLRKAETRKEYYENSVYKSSVYNISNTGGSIMYNSATGAIISEMTDCDFFDLPTADKIKLVQNGFYVPSDYDEFLSIQNQFRNKDKDVINYFTVVLTTACNARCFYCYEENYCKQIMSKEKIDDLVDFISNQSKKDDSLLTLDWYGGEPLLCVGIIDEIIEKLSMSGVLKNREWISSITTNATLFDEELINHAIEKWNLSVAHITIDGNEQQHNNRKNVNLKGNSAYRVTWNAIYNLLKKGVYVNLRVHLDNDNRENFGEILEDIAEFFEFANFHLSPTYLFPPEFEMTETYIKDEEKEDLFYDVFRLMKEKKTVTNYIALFPKPKKCGCFATNPHSAVVAPDGSFHACVQEFSSQIDWKGDQKFADFINVGSECAKCKFFPICLGGCVHNRFLKDTVRTPCVRNRYVIAPLLKLLEEYEE